MKTFKLLFLVILPLSVTLGNIPLNGDWLFNIGDDSSWAQIDINDSAWYSINVPGSWEDQGFANYDGIAWYRTHFILDSSYLKYDTLFLHLGKVGSSAQIFLNGLGLKDSAAVIDSSKSNLLKIPSDNFLFENLLAIKITNLSGPGGIFGRPIILSNTLLPQKQPLPKRHVEHRSWYNLPFSNGISSAVYNLQLRDFSAFSPHIYNQINNSEKTELVATSARTILFKNRRELDLKEMETVSSGYINGTGIVHHKLRSGNCVLDQYAFSPFSNNSAFWVIFAVLSGDSIANYALNFEFTDLAPGMNIGKWSFQENNRKWLFVVGGYDKTLDPKSYTVIRKYKNENPGFSALLNEINWWKEWQKSTIVPADITQNERSVYLQSLAFLKMAQVRERFPARGQIVSTFPPSPAATASVSGMVFSIDALLRSGHFEEALAALQFIMNNNGGALKHYTWAGENRGIGQNYAISLNYYTGNGTEATDSGEFGPIIYLSNFGLVLWNLKQYVEITDDYRFLEYYWPRISAEIADIIINSIDASGLVRADNGYYNPGAPKHYFFTSAAAYRGLVDAVWLARMVNDETRAQQYEQAAIKLRNTIEDKLIDDDNIVKSYLESDATPLDAASAPGLLWVFSPQDVSCRETLAMIEKELYLGAGFRRFLPDNRQSGNEWIPGNIFIINLNQYMTNFKKSTTISQWMGNQAYKNFGIIPQYFDCIRSDYTGIIPLIGPGAGLYVSSFWGE